MQRLVAVPVVALALLAAACGGSGEPQAGDQRTMGVAGKDAISLELDDDYFEPTVLEGEPGQELRIELENEGSHEHNFSIDEQSTDQDVEADGKAEVTVTFPQSGELRFYCKYHVASGMTGALRSSG